MYSESLTLKPQGYVQMLIIMARPKTSFVRDTDKTPGKIDAQLNIQMGNIYRCIAKEFADNHVIIVAIERYFINC